MYSFYLLITLLLDIFLHFCLRAAYQKYRQRPWGERKPQYWCTRTYLLFFYITVYILIRGQDMLLCNGSLLLWAKLRSNLFNPDPISEVLSDPDFFSSDWNTHFLCLNINICRLTKKGHSFLYLICKCKYSPYHRCY